MKFKVNRSELSEAVTVTQRAVSGKSSLPALEGILLKVNEDSVRLTGYDLDMGIETSIRAEVSEQGEFIIMAKMFSDIVRKLSGDIVSIEVDEKYLTQIKCGGTEYKILGMSGEEFPEFPQVKDEITVKLSQSILKSMIDQTLFAISQNDIKPIHTGTLFEINENGEIRLVSVDGFRLALRKEKVKAAESIKFVVPGKALAEITKILEETDEETTLLITKRNISVSVGNYKIYSRLLEGDFLDYNNAIPKDGNVKIKVNVRSFIDAVERTGLLISDRLKSPLRIKFERDEIFLSCSTALGKATDVISSVMTGGEPLEMGFNNRYLLDALKNSQCDEVLLQISGPLSPMKVLPCDGDSFVFLVLPVRLKAE
ncbi:MAG: DNA polymerase III subunit beta [Oscillospiraceae bacterium]